MFILNILVIFKIFRSIILFSRIYNLNKYIVIYKYWQSGLISFLTIICLFFTQTVERVLAQSAWQDREIQRAILSLLEDTSQVKLHLTNHDSIVNQLLDKRASFQLKVSFRSVTVSCTSGTTCGAALESWQGGFHKFVVQNLSGFELKRISNRFLKFI